MEIRKVGVVGAGVMGVGLGQSLAQTGHEAVLVDVSGAILDKARGEIRQGLRFQGMFQKGAQREDPKTVLGRIAFTTDLAALAEVDFVIENVPEKWELKREVYPRLDALCPERAVFAVNTSCISITRVGGLTGRPDRVIGMHFMNPVPLKPMVEVIRGHHTSDETLETARQLLRQMGKDCIVVGDLPGFVSNRILMLTINEAVCVLQDGVATAEQVDQLFKTCFGHKMGPLETADLIGLDTILFSIEVLYDSYKDSKYRPSPLLAKMVDAGLLGRKSGRGFYDYGVAV
ncbi:MAG: 3-hydroxybutyryl-CoA dehydrogenase [Acidobacteria bacterium]|nr:3-hydroxybutyryl-CoA dehydrogenase [Acidobacteriota bacterium]